jgi:hypothetical protein
MVIKLGILPDTVAFSVPFKVSVEQKEVEAYMAITAIPLFF